MDFAPTTLFVVPVGNTLPTSGSTEDLTAGQFGIFKDKLRTVATAGNVGTAAYIQLAQGRPGTGLGTKLSDRIKASNVKSWYKVVGHSQAADEIWEIGGFSVKKGEAVSITVNIHGTIPSLISDNGLTLNVSIPAECLDCGADPCEVIPNDTIVDAFMAEIQKRISAQNPAGNAVKLDSFLTWEKKGAAGSTVIRITSKPVTRLAEVPERLNSLNIDKDRIWFVPYVTKSTDTFNDVQAADACDTAATITLIQRSSFKTGTPDEIRIMERDFYSYQAKQKNLFNQSGWNQEFQSYVDPSKTYDLYFIRFAETAQDSAVFAPYYPIDWRVILAVPNDATTGIEAILTAYLGAITDASGTAITTTTSTTTSTSSSTTSTTTTVAIP